MALNGENNKKEIKKIGGSKIEICGEIDKEDFQRERQKALLKFRQETTIDGFRKGQSPENLVIQKVGEMAVLEEAAESLINEFYSEIIKAGEIEPVGRPQVLITKLASENNLEFKITTAVMPEIKLATYEEIAKNKNRDFQKEPEVSDAELQEFLDQVKKESDIAMETRTGESPQEPFELDDNYAKKLGLNDLSELKERIRTDLKQAKIEQEKNKKRMAIMEDIISSSEIELPEIMIEGELQNMLGRFRGDIERANLNFDDYLSKAGSSVEKIAVEWRPQAEKKAKLQLILNKIAKDKNIKAGEKELQTGIEAIMKEHPNADRRQAETIVETMLLNEDVFNFLENLI